ncbi:MAG: Smr/MutS family protein [Candidatus Promineofilum sp.]|nr:Smr/MutS family protein [Promineifilum sp.]MBP9656943.1 Smr/MutS family protein [Promineifilum sp.]
MIDQKTLSILEFIKIRELVAGHANFSGGRELALAMQPTTDLTEARAWQTETREAVSLFETDSGVTIGGARDVRRAADNAMRGFVLPAEDLLAIQATIVAGRNLRRQLLRLEDRVPHLVAIANLIEECRGIVSAITGAIDERGDVLDSASPSLARVRQSQRMVHGRIQDKLQRILNSSMSQFLQEPIITQRGGRYVIPVRADAKGRLKGIVHDQSGSGATLWVEPLGTVELNNEYRGLLLEEQEEIQRILRELSNLVADQGDAVKRVVERMAELDLIFARAGYALVTNAVEPVFVPWRESPKARPPRHRNQLEDWTPPPPDLHPGSSIWIKAARHPLLDPARVVPTNLTLDEDIFIVLITGPNTGGKTVSLKTMGLMAVMAQSGLHLPANEARLTVFDAIFADIGDEQSIEQSLSTFSAHMSNIVRILAQVNDRSLVLLDELGSGTDPTEGAALAQAVVNFLRDKGATTFVATHFPELKIYASQMPGATNASLLFDMETLSPTYEMTIGLPGRSNAFAIARRLGLDATILDDAMRQVSADSHQAEDLLDSIYTLREKMEAEEAQTRKVLRDAEAERERLRRRQQDVEVERERILEETRQEMKRQIELLQTEIRQARTRLKDAASVTAVKKLSKQAADLEVEQQATLAPEPVGEPEVSRGKRRALQVGDIVQVRSLNVKGEIVSLGKSEVVVAVGRLQMRAGYDDVEFRERPSDEREVEAVANLHPSPGIELDIRGVRVEDGVEQLQRYIDSAFLARLPFVRIIHGKGTGRLRQAVRESLSASKQVRAWEEGKDGEGGPGVTVAHLVEHK